MKRLLATILCLCLVFSLSACGASATTAKPAGATTSAATTPAGTTKAATSAGRTSYKIGLPTMKTGAGSEKGLSGMQSVQIAVEEINAAGGINGVPIELVIEDTASDSSQAIQIAKRFIENKEIVGIVGCDNTANSMATISYYEEAKMPFISIMASSNTFAPKSEYAFTVSGMVKNEVECTASMVGDYLKSPTMAMVYVNNDWGKSFTTNIKEACEKAGVKVLATESYVDGEKDFSSLLTKVRQLKPDALFIASQYAEASAIVNAVREMNWDVKITGTGAITNDSFLKLAGKNAEGVYAYSATVWTEEYPVAVSFAKKYTAKYGTNPNVFCCGWEAMWAMADALKQSPEKVTRQELTNAIKGLKTIKGLNGDMVWDDVGNTVKNYGYMKVVNGVWKVDGYYVANKK